MSEYKQTQVGVIIRLSDGAFIPDDQENTDWQDYLQWLEAGNSPEPADVPDPVPPTVTMRQARLALLGAGLLGNVNAAIDALPGTQKDAARIEWEYSQVVERHRQLVSVLAPALGLTSAQIDALFIAAAKL